jgi:hypothetical protein
MAGREVVQVYARNTLKGEVLPRHQLVAFTSVEIPAGQVRVVTLSVEEYWLCSVNSAGERVLPDSCTLFVGGSQPDELSGELCGTRPLELKLI